MNIWNDLKFALRQLRRSPGFTAGVILVLALGIGANAAMFTVLEATLFRPLPYKQSERLTTLSTTTVNDDRTPAQLADIEVWQQRSRTVDAISYFDSTPAYLITQNATQKIDAVTVSVNLFATLGVAPAFGRGFTADEVQPGKGTGVILSDLVWRTQFHADPKVLGQSVKVDNAASTVVGIMPPGFTFPLGPDESPAQVWKPVQIDPAHFGRMMDAQGFETIVRLRDGATVQAAEAELNGIQKQLLPLYTGEFAPFFAPAHVQAVNYKRSLTDKDQRTALLALLGAVASLWLIACANVACLMLARTASRRRELAVRSALGASRWRLIQQTLVESLLLSLSGTGTGMAMAMATLRFFRHSLTTQLSPYLSLRPDLRVMAVLAGLTLLSALLFGLVPSWIASRASVEQALRTDGAQAGTARHQHRLQRVLVVSELSLTLALLVSCGLLLRTVLALRKVPLGFRTDHVYVLDPKLPGYKYDAIDKNATVFEPLLTRLKTMPGVDAAAITTVAPLTKGFAMQFGLSVGEYGSKGQSGKPTKITANMQAMGPEMQQVLGFGMARGRYFDAQDTPETPLAAVVNSAFARLYEPSSGDVSKFSLQMTSKDASKPRGIKIVGVLDDLHQVGIAASAFPEIDVNAAQMRPDDGFYQPTLNAHVELVLRSSRDPKDLIPELQRIMVQQNPDLVSTEIRTMDQIVDDAMGSQLLAAHLLEALGTLALIVALAGLYSLLAYLVTLRTRELGLRLALGAQRSDILSLILRGAGALLLTGTAVGIGLSLITARLLHSFLFGVKEYDPVTLAAAPILLLFVGAIAAWLPARRAARLEPMQALRTE